MSRYSKVVLAVLDGLRPDAVTPEVMPFLHAMGARYWQAAHAVTVSPSVTVAALSSLATGVGPATHGLIEPGFRTLGMFSGLTLMPNYLRRHDRQVTVITSDLPRGAYILARTLLGIAGAVDLVPGGDTPATVADTAVREVIRRGPGLSVVYLNDCDQVGHAEMWMSPLYLEAAARLDRGIARLADLATRDDALLIVTADHGGGGIVPDDHDGDHPLNLRIPLVLAARGVRQGVRSQTPAHLLDIPATILSVLGLPVPKTYEGRVLAEAFLDMAQAVA